MLSKKIDKKKGKSFIIFDLEATCWDEKGKFQSEIIEIGALKINDNQEIVGEFNAFVKPILNPQLSDFCKGLCSIQQKDIDSAQIFPIVLEKFKEWIGINSDYLLCSWGFFDQKQLTADCNLHKLEKDWLEKHISIKHQHGILKKLKRPAGLSYALKMEDMQFEGTAHRGIDDARNIARIFLKYFGDWKYIEL